MERPGDVVFRHLEYFVVDFKDQWLKGGHKGENEKEEAEVDEHAPEEEVFEDLGCHGVGCGLYVFGMRERIQRESRLIVSFCTPHIQKNSVKSISFQQGKMQPFFRRHQ
ncbi:MAG: hypothetical protein WBM35_04035 [Candidatus Electrothrix sp.]